MLDPGGLVVLVVLLDKDGEGVRGLGCGGGGSSLGLGGHLLAVDHQLEPGRGTCAQPPLSDTFFFSSDTIFGFFSRYRCDILASEMTFFLAFS